MKPTDDRLDSLLRDARQDPRPLSRTAAAARGLEARVLQRLARPESWAEAIFSLTSWRPLAAALVTVAAIALFTGGGAADVFSDEWLHSQTAEEAPEDLTAGEIAELDL